MRRLYIFMRVKNIIEGVLEAQLVTHFHEFLYYVEESSGGVPFLLVYDIDKRIFLMQ